MFFFFICRDESLAALHEAIRMAQETNDHECLQHALVSDEKNIRWHPLDLVGLTMC